MDYPGFVTAVYHQVAYIYRDGFIYNVISDIGLKPGDWVLGSFDPVTNTCNNIVKTYVPLKTFFSDESFYFIGGYHIGMECVKPFGKIDISNVPSCYKTNEVVIALFKLEMDGLCDVSVDEILFPFSTQTFHPSSVIPVNTASQTMAEIPPTDNKDKGSANKNQDLSNDPFYSLSDPKFLGAASDDSDSDIPIDFDPIPAQYRRPPSPVVPKEEVPPPPPPKDYDIHKPTKPILPFHYGSNYIPPSQNVSFPVRKPLTPSPSTSPDSSTPPEIPRHESSKNENLNKVSMQKQSLNSEDSFARFSTDSENLCEPFALNANDFRSIIWTPPYSRRNSEDAEDEFSSEEEGEYDINPESFPRAAPYAYSDNDDDARYNINSNAYESENSDNSFALSNNSFDNKSVKIQNAAILGDANKEDNESEDDEELVKLSSNVDTCSTSDDCLKFVSNGSKEFMNDITAWGHVYCGQKLANVKTYGNLHLLFAKFKDFAILYDSEGKDKCFGVIFRDESNLKYYDGLIVGGIYRGAMGDIFDNHSENGMPNLSYYLIRPELVKQCEIDNSVFVNFMKKRKSITNSWSYGTQFVILQVERFGSVAFPLKYFHLFGRGALIKGTVRFYVHPRINYYWSFVGEFEYFLDNERGETIYIDESETFYHYLKTTYCEYLSVAGPGYFTPSCNKKQVSSGSKNKKDGAPMDRHGLDALIPKFENFDQKFVYKSLDLKNLQKKFEFV